MKIDELTKKIFLNVAKLLGLELVKKTESDIDYSEKGLNPTAIGAGVIANIAIDDSDIIIEGENARADAMRKIAEYYTDEIQNAIAEVSLGTGDAIVRPFTDGKDIGFHILGNENFIITKCIGNKLKGIIMLIDEYTKNKKVYRLFESQTIKENGDMQTIVYIRRFAYVDDKEIALVSTSWNEIPGEEIIFSEQLLIGRYKCPTINRENYNSANGVPITFGNEEIVDNIKTKYKQYNEEFDRKQAKTFVGQTMLKTPGQPEGIKKQIIDGHVFLKTKGGVDGGVKGLIEDYSPAIRETEFQTANNFNFSILELCCGFSRGIFTAPETAFATATEMKNSLKKTFSFIKRFRRRLEAGDKMLFKAVNIIMNINATTPIGNWYLRHDWSYDYIEETKERFNQLMQGHSAGVVKDETVCAWINNLSEKEATKYMAELKASAKSEIVEE